jgi:DNA-binding XRE family transcriptional regulator
LPESNRAGDSGGIKTVREKMLRTGNQLRAARGLVGMSQNDVAERAGVHKNTIAAMEKRGAEELRNPFHIVQQVARALEAAGVIFLDGNGHGPGVVLRKSSGEPATPAKHNGTKAGTTKKPTRRSEPDRPAAW